MITRRDFVRAGSLLVPSAALADVSFGIRNTVPGKSTPRLRLHDGINLGYGFSEEGNPPGWDNYIRSEQSAAGAALFTFPGDDDTMLPTEASVKSVAATKAAEEKPTDMLDFENWPESTQEERQTTKTYFDQVGAWWLEAYPDSVFGFYAGTPKANPRADIIAGSGAGFDAWQAINDDLNFVDSSGASMIMPSLYLGADHYAQAAPYNDLRTWIDNMMVECLRLTSKPIFPFIWGIFHPGATGLNGAITNISTANPAVVTVAANRAADLTTGDMVRFSELSGSDELEQTFHTVTAITSETFSIDGVDGSTLTPYVSDGRYDTCVPQDMFDTVLEKIAEYTPHAVYWDYFRIAGVGPAASEMEKMPSWKAIKASRLIAPG